MLKPEVLVKLTELGYSLTGEIRNISVQKDPLLWRFANEMIENSSRADACEELFTLEEDSTDTNHYWYLICGMGQGEMFLLYTQVSSVGVYPVVMYGVTEG